jgi:hypothetical protein
MYKGQSIQHKVTKEELFIVYGNFFHHLLHSHFHPSSSLLTTLLFIWTFPISWLLCCNCVTVRCVAVLRRPLSSCCAAPVSWCMSWCVQYSTHHDTHRDIFHKIRGISWLAEDLLALPHGVSWLVTVTVWTWLRAQHRLIYHSAAPCGMVFLLKFMVNCHQTLGVTWPHFRCRSLTVKCVV